MPGSIMPGSAQARLVRNSVVPYYKAVFDERFGDPCAFAAGAAERGIPTVAIRGDITKLFFDDLDLRWKQGPVLLAGYTTPASLFCLDLLARDRGMRVRHCVTGPSVEAALGVLDGTLRTPMRDTHAVKRRVRSGLLDHCAECPRLKSAAHLRPQGFDVGTELFYLPHLGERSSPAISRQDSCCSRNACIWSSARS